MILIVTRTDDYTCDYVVERLNELEISYLRLNTDEVSQLRKLSFVANPNVSYIIYNGKKLTVKSVWFRRVGIPKLSDDYSTFEEQYVYREFKELIYSIQYYLYNVVWMSDPEKIRIAENKSLQLLTAKKLGFKIPSTVITADILKSLNLVEYKINGAILKPIYMGRYFNGKENLQIFTNRITEQILMNSRNNPLPSIVQNEIAKDLELRVTVVDNECFSAATNSQKDSITSVDWRRGESKFFKYDLPQEIEVKCIKLTKKLGLNFGAIDLIKDKSGEYVFIENNPNGQWAWIEFETGLPIREKIIKTLDYGNR